MSNLLFGIFLLRLNILPSISYNQVGSVLCCRNRSTRGPGEVGWRERKGSTPSTALAFSTCQGGARRKPRAQQPVPPTCCPCLSLGASQRPPPQVSIPPLYIPTSWSSVEFPQSPGWLTNCWVAPHRTASLVDAKPGDWPMSPETATETSVVYWTRGSYRPEVRPWSDVPTVCIRTQQLTLLHRGEEAAIYRGNWHQIGSSVTKGTSSWGMSLTASQINNHHKGRYFPLIN